MKKLSLFLFTLILLATLPACATNEKVDDNNQNGTSSSVSSDVAPSEPSPYYVAPSDNNQSNITGDTKISKDKAIEIALNHAGLKKESVRDIDAELDREKGVTVWEIDFESGNTDYSYDINAETGGIVNYKSERDD